MEMQNTDLLITSFVQQKISYLVIGNFKIKNIVVNCILFLGLLSVISMQHGTKSSLTRSSWPDDLPLNLFQRHTEVAIEGTEGVLEKLQDELVFV